MSAARTLILVCALAAAGCRGPKPESGLEMRCAHLQTERPVRGIALCEDVWTCERPPAGRFDRITLHRVAPCEGATGPVVLYLPGMHMNGELPLLDARHDLRLYLAQAGIRTWGLSYRTHAVPPDATAADLAVLDAWNAKLFADDATWAAGFVRGADGGPLVIAGFSYGAGLAYRLSTREPLAGLIILDGIAGPPGASGGGGAALDVGSSRLPFAERRALLEQVVADPRGAAGEQLAELLYTSERFGGRGGLSDAAHGVADIGVVARLLATYDRWWPRAALGGDAPKPPRAPLPVLAFASANMGPEWVSRVRTSAEAFGGKDAVVRELRGFGHLDVLVGRDAPRLVFEPARAWLVGG